MPLGSALWDVLAEAGIECDREREERRIEAVCREVEMAWLTRELLDAVPEGSA